MTVASGSCYCGAVSFTLPLPVKWCAHCHCTMCRRLHGAAFVSWFGIEQKGCVLDERDVTWYRSSAHAERGHCRHCASPLFFRSSRWPGELHVVLAAMHNNIGLAPQAHIYCQDAVSWGQDSDALPRYAGLPDTDPAHQA